MYIEKNAQGMGICRAWINNCEVRIKDGFARNADGERIDGHPKWQLAFAMISKPQEAI